jgi:hypothetical protein
MRVISLGWGCQSFALCAMSALGLLPRVDAAIHADTTHERAQTYDFARRWTPWLEERGVRVATVRSGRAGVIENWTGTGLMIPAFTRYENGDPSGTLGRQCTRDWKISPIRRWLQANRGGKPVELWLGITLDEVTRMKPSDVQYIANAYPFVEMLDRPWTRGMVVRWLLDNGLEVPVKSACVFCPFHDRATWREIKLGGDGDWREALEADGSIRRVRDGYLCYLTPERKPLEDCDFSNEEDHGQLSLWDDAECEGMCFL